VNQAEAKALIIDVLAGIAPEADFTGLPGQAQLRDELDLDSMDFLNFISALHERTNLDIPESDYSQLSTLHDAISYLCR
jgi:acyl carrier protein